MVFIEVNFSYSPRAIHRFPIFEIVSFAILFGSQMSYSAMGLWSIFSILLIFGQRRFSQISVSPCFSSICPFSDMSFWSDVFGPYVHCVICLWVICPFGQMSLDNMSFRAYIFRLYVRSAICLSAICPTTEPRTPNLGRPTH